MKGAHKQMEASLKYFDITDAFLNQKRVNYVNTLKDNATWVADKDHQDGSQPSSTYLQLLWCNLYHVFPYIYSFLIEEDICDRCNVSVKLPCVYVRRSSRDLFIFCKSFLFLFLLLCYPYFSTFSFHVVSNHIFFYSLIRYGRILSVCVYYENFCAFINFRDNTAPGKAMKALQGKLIGGKNILIRFPNNAGTQSNKRSKAM